MGTWPSPMEVNKFKLDEIFEKQGYYLKRYRLPSKNMEGKTTVDYLIVDTTAFIQNVHVETIGKTVITCKEVVNEVHNSRQRRRLVVLPYELEIKEPFPENIRIITKFSKKTGDYPSLSATDIKVMALTYQLEKEKVGSTDHLRTEPVVSRPIVNTERAKPDMNPDITGFYLPKGKNKKTKPLPDLIQTTVPENANNDLGDRKLLEDIKSLQCNDIVDETLPPVESEKEGAEDVINKILPPVKTEESNSEDENSNSEDEDSNFEDEDSNYEDVDSTSEHEYFNADDDENGWINPSNLAECKKQVNSEVMEEKHVTVACMTTDFAMQNVLKQMNLNIVSFDGRVIKKLRTYLLRCYSCFKTTSLMDKKFCPKCGNDTLKKVAVSTDEDGKIILHINSKKPLSGRGKKFSLPRIKGGKHPNNPILVEDQPMPDNKPSRLARTKNNPLVDEFVAGYSPFVTRDINSRAARLGIRGHESMKNWMRKNPNEARRKKK